MDMFRAQLHEFFATMTSLVTGKVSLDRLDDFLCEVSTPVHNFTDMD